MHLTGLNLNLLVVLDALLREKSVTKTAVRLNVTQPAISSALQRLREYLEDPLHERNGRKVDDRKSVVARQSVTVDVEHGGSRINKKETNIIYTSSTNQI